MRCPAKISVLFRRLLNRHIHPSDSFTSQMVELVLPALVVYPMAQNRDCRALEDLGTQSLDTGFSQDDLDLTHYVENL